MRRTVRFGPDEALPLVDDQALLRSQGLPARSDLPPRVRDTLDAAFERYRQLVEPRGVLQEISIGEFAEVYTGEGRNPPRTVLDTIFPRADRLALFAATLGERVTSAITDLFRAGEPALGYMLDAVASQAADALADRLAEDFLDWCREQEAGPSRSRVLPYSPGYCGWDLSGQARLFDRLMPEEIGIELTPRFLMRPLKSVSGVLVAGTPEIHRVPADFPFCDQCEARRCRERMASILGS